MRSVHCRIGTRVNIFQVCDKSNEYLISCCATLGWLLFINRHNIMCSYYAHCLAPLTFILTLIFVFIFHIIIIMHLEDKLFKCVLYWYLFLFNVVMPCIEYKKMFSNRKIMLENLRGELKFAMRRLFTTIYALNYFHFCFILVCN